MDFLNQADEIIPNLWLGSYPDDNAKDFTRVFSVTDAGFGPFLDANQIVIRCPLKDTNVIPPVQTIYALADMVNQAVDSGHKTLVHCTAGINRSSLIVAVALMKRGYTAKAAIAHLRRKRHEVVLLNRTFENWLLTSA